MRHRRPSPAPRVLAVLAVTALGAAAFSATRLLPVQAASLTSTATADTFTSQAAPGVNYAGWPRWSGDARPGVQRHAYLRFDVAVPAGEQVATATLTAWPEAASTGPGVSVYQTSDDWTESGVTWDNEPARGALVTTSGAYPRGAYVRFDVTQGVPAAGGVVSFRLETTEPRWLGFHSRENTADRPPQLVITTSPVDTPTEAAPTPTDTPTDAASTPTDTPTDAASTPTDTPTDAASTPTDAPPCSGAAAPATYDHVIWIIFENKAPVVGSSSAPTFSSLAAECGVTTSYTGITHPSLPNYLALTGGSTFGVTDDSPPSSHPIAGESLFSQLGTRWRSYQESMPSNCLLTSSGDYAVKHNPAAYFTGVRTACDSQDVPMGTTSSGAFHDAVTGGTLPAFSLVTPNMCNDMHDCSVATGDEWLRSWMAQILASPTYAAGRTAVLITFDEDDGSAGNVVSTVVVAPSVVAGTRSGAAFDHYSLLRTTEEMLGLPTTVGEAATAASMRDAFHL